MRTYTFSIGGVRVELRGTPDGAGQCIRCLTAAFQRPRGTDGDQRPRPAEDITRAARPRPGSGSGSDSGMAAGGGMRMRMADRGEEGLC